jgi:DNA-binding beta-propeller fold protein YncE
VNYSNSYLAIPGTIGGFEPAPMPRIPNWPAGANPQYRHEVVLGSGKFGPPSITVYPADAHGNVAPLRIIEGPKAQLDWPTGLAADPDHGEIYVSNAVGDSVVVFSATAQGDVAPIRVIKGPHTQLKNPTGLAFDAVNDELWVANFGNYEATVYKRGASGDAAPIRVIRSAPAEARTTLFSNPYSLAYDSRRDQILVANCVGQPRVAAFEKLADKDALPVRKVEGTKSLLSRTVHSLQYDAIHDEFIVNQNIAQAVLTFRGAADGEEPPVRVIQGPSTMMRDPEKVVVDAVHDELFVFNQTSGGQRQVTDKILVFDRKAKRDVAPIRVLSSPGAMFITGVVDPVHNLLIVGARIKDVGTRVMFFDRTADGVAKPKAILGGPKSGLGGTSVLAVYPPTGKLVILTGSGGRGGDEDVLASGAYAGVWNITDEGDVPPQYTVGKGMLVQVRGMTLDTKDKNIVINDKELQGVLTFALPQMFSSDAPKATSTSSRQ